ncbi:MAG: putative metal-binding motif-containing protein [Myxococcota bacterium]|nr:putative metal-binding motif-containing protein [Myxococcota bacterium]
MSTEHCGPQNQRAHHLWGPVGLLVAALLLTCAPATAAEGGPDLAGYSWADSSSGGPTFNYEVETSAPPADLGNRPADSDDAYTTVALPFQFFFYGLPYSEIDIHSNGGLTFGASEPLSHTPSCSSPGVPAILPYWSDLYPQDGQHGVFYWTGGTAPNRYFVVEWYQIAQYTQGGDDLTFEVKLFEDDSIEFHYQDLNGDGPDDDGANAAVLIAGKDPISGNDSQLEISCFSQSVLFSGTAIGIFPPDCPDIDGDGSRSCEGDCNDNNDTVYPGAPELCDGLDNNCDLVLPGDEVDEDSDGFRLCDDDCDDDDATLTPADLDNDGYSTCTGDCDDNNDDASPEDKDGDGATGCEGDCNDSDEVLNTQDEDSDGLSSCEGDCLDTNNTVRPGSGELCDGLDNDCDGSTDENPNCATRGGEDGEGFGIAYGCILSCGQAGDGEPMGGRLALLSCMLGLLFSIRRRGVDE